MPFDSNESLPKGVKGLPAGQQTKWRKVFNSAYEGTCKNGADRDKCASKVAWNAIDDKYKGKSKMLTEFSMAIRSATHDKQKDTLRWKAVASDTDEDFYHDNMSLELFNDFVNRIEIKELVPENFRSTFWSGGEPYLSISHYPDLEGEAVAGSSEKTYIDGSQLKSTGQFKKTPLGLASYHAICKDLYTEPKTENPIRISIAFLDWGHIHKSNGYEFERECIDDICPECIAEAISGEFAGKIFKKGQLVHLALTRVPANERTSMEVEKSMVNRKEDAASIVGEELADEIDKKAKLTQKSLAKEEPEMLVIKAEDEEEVTEEAEKVEETPTEPEPIVEEAKVKEEEKPEEDEEDEEKDCAGKKKSMLTIDERLDKIEKMLSSSSPVPATLETIERHELDEAFGVFKSAFDEVKTLDASSDEKLMQLQGHFVELANVVKAQVQASAPKVEQSVVEANADLAQVLAEALKSAMQPVYQKLDLIATQKQSETVVKSQVATPVRRSIAPTLSMQHDINPLGKQLSPQPKSGYVNLHELVRKSVGGLQ